jgi:uncharacterized protein YbjT (DUF2867 family)
MMNVLVFGATGMVGQGVLRECLLDLDVRTAQTVGRTATGLPAVAEASREKLRDVVHADMWEYASIAGALAGFDACFFCLGVASSGMKEADYEHITYGITLAAAETLCKLNPRMTFIYVSGAGTDSSEKGRIMWARVKGKTENTLLRLPFASAYMFRPGVIEPLHGIKSKTGSYRVMYSIAAPVLPLFRRLFPDHVLTTEQIGRAMLAVAKSGFPKRILESQDIRLAAGG